MTFFLIGLALFLAVHSISIVSPTWRNTQVALHGEPVWKGTYAVVSILGLLLLVYGYGLARQTPVVLYTPPTALRHVSLLLMAPVFALLLATYLPGRIQTAARHPMLLAVKIWATAHLLANGTLVDVLLFGSFLAWAVAGRISAKRRTTVARTTPGAPPSPLNDVIVVGGGLALYAVTLLWAHRWLIGVSPLG